MVYFHTTTSIDTVHLTFFSATHIVINIGVHIMLHEGDLLSATGGLEVAVGIAGVKAEVRAEGIAEVRAAPLHNAFPFQYLIVDAGELYVGIIVIAMVPGSTTAPVVG